MISRRSLLKSVALAALAIIMPRRSLAWFRHGTGGGGGGYVAKAVHFDGSAVFTNDSLTSTDSGDFGLSGWFNVVDWSANPTIFVVDPVASDNTYMDGEQPNVAVLHLASGDNSSRSSVTTPPLLAPGWHSIILAAKTDLAPSPTNNWWVSISGDGTKYIASAQNDYIYTSGDGVTWTKQINSGVATWLSSKVSHDGSVIVAVAGDGNAHVSVDGGANWDSISVSGAVALGSAAVSSDGSHMVVGDTDAGGFVYISTDTGTTWTQKAIGQGWSDVTMTPDGTKMYAVSNAASELYRSTNSGSSFSQVTVTGSHGLYTITASSDGTKIAIGTFDASGSIFVSTNSGVAWSDVVPHVGSNWYGIDSSAAWENLIAVDNGIFSRGGFAWGSIDGGVSWSHVTDGNFYSWISCGISADGQKIIAGASGDGAIVHTSSDAGAVWDYRRVVPNTRILVGYVDRVRAISGYTDSGPAFNVALNALSMLIGQDTFGDNYIGDMADLWIANQSLLTGEVIAPATLDKFIDPNGKPVYLGANGELPTGSAPLVFGSGDADTFLQPNLGTAGAFARTGSLTNATTSPSD